MSTGEAANLSSTFDVHKFVEDFDLFAEVPSGVQALRGLVLDLAVRGQLVASAAPPVGQTLGSLIPSRDFLVIDAPWALPSRWEWVRLGDVASLINGDRSKNYPSKIHQVADGVPFINAGHLVNGTIEWREMNYITPDRFAMLRSGKIQEGDLLYCLRGSLGKCGIVVGRHEGAVASSLVIIRVNKSCCDEAYLLNYLDSSLGQAMIRKYDNGTAQPNLSAADVAKYMVPIPPLGEQKRIVAKVDELTRLLDDLEAKQTKKRKTQTRLRTVCLDALTLADGPDESVVAWKGAAGNFEVLFDQPGSVTDLRATILDLAVRGRLSTTVAESGRSGVALLEETLCERRKKEASGALRKVELSESTRDAPFSLPDGWTWASIGETFDVVGGIQKTPARAPKQHHTPYLRVENVQRGRLDLDRMERFEIEPGELEKWRLERDDLLVIEGNGSGTEIGRCARWDGSIADCVHQNHIIRCRPLGRMTGTFTLLFLNSPTGMAEMRRLAVTTSGLYSLSVGKVRSVLVPVPGEQQGAAVLAEVERLLKLCDDLEAKLRHADATAGKLVEAVINETVARA